ncbi:uncharacterized protein I303_104418 [Kwoniella dejecticola CBS 10117]|uniref:Uncharacterized protein n=1 Tax=Kwoniella dejecticola CBS 10117 TaxID=1296121 RepID=A0A1A6A5E0_9TREE|nr:uncharacterized protein I303_04603 [Kwoniella dejecticola CBS 10117]OBR85270.1 hypothetical protein I303_04603 [Kwoniella dejecticola CBS 10117]
MSNPHSTQTHPPKASDPSLTGPNGANALSGGTSSARKDSGQKYDSSSISTSAYDAASVSQKQNEAASTHLDSAGGVMGSASPACTTFSPTTTVTESNSAGNTLAFASPDPSIMAVHGSVMTNFPMPRDRYRAGKNAEMSGDEWDKIASKLNKGSVSLSRGMTMTKTLPETPIETDMTGPPMDTKEGKTTTDVNGKEEKQSDVNVFTHGGEMEKQKQEQKQIEDINPVYKNDRVIAIDFDDVCSENMATIIKQHNMKYGTDLTIDDLQTYVFWQNRGWGTPAEVARKVQTLNNLLSQTTPIPGFAEGLRALHTLGHPVHIITSRPAKDREGLTRWLNEQGVTIGPGERDVIAQAHFTGAYDDVNSPVAPRGEDDEFEKELNKRLKELWADGVGKGKGGLSKLKILREINASLFIDDHHGNLKPIIRAQAQAEAQAQAQVQAETATPPIQCLLFGEYGWNKSRSGLATPVEMMDYTERSEKGLSLPADPIEFGPGKNLDRVKDWKELVEWVKGWDRAVVDDLCLDT